MRMRDPVMARKWRTNGANGAHDGAKAVHCQIANTGHSLYGSSYALKPAKQLKSLLRHFDFSYRARNVFQALVSMTYGAPFHFLPYSKIEEMAHAGGGYGLAAINRPLVGPLFNAAQIAPTTSKGAETAREIAQPSYPKENTGMKNHNRPDRIVVRARGAV